MSYINAGLPVVLSPDDPGIMRHSFSHDFYAAFMAWCLDLRDLKQLAMNSLLHSAMSPDEKRRALAPWRARWEVFVGWLNEGETPEGSHLRSGAHGVDYTAIPAPAVRISAAKRGPGPGR